MTIGTALFLVFAAIYFIFIYPRETKAQKEFRKPKAKYSPYYDGPKNF